MRANGALQFTIFKRTFLESRMLRSNHVIRRYVDL